MVKKFLNNLLEWCWPAKIWSQFDGDIQDADKQHAVWAREFLKHLRRGKLLRFSHFVQAQQACNSKQNASVCAIETAHQ